MKRYIPFLFLSTFILTFTIPANANTIIRNGKLYNRDYHYQRNNDDYRRNFRNDDYTLKSESTNAAGEKIKTRVDYEEDRNGYTRETTTRGPDGLIERKKVEVERSGNKVEQKTTTTNADGKISIDRKEYRLND